MRLTLLLWMMILIRCGLECTWSTKKLYILILVKISRDIVYCKDQNNCYMLFSKTGFTNDMKMIAKKDDGMLFDCNTIVQQIQ